MAGNALDHVMNLTCDGMRQMEDTTLWTKATQYGGKNTGTCDKRVTKHLELRWKRNIGGTLWRENNWIM